MSYDLLLLLQIIDVELNKLYLKISKSLKLKYETYKIHVGDYRIKYCQ